MNEKEAIALVKKKLPTCSIKETSKVKNGFVISCTKNVDGESSFIQPIFVFGKNQIRGLNENYAPDKKILNDVYKK